MQDKVRAKTTNLVQSHRAPLHVGSVTLAVHDLARASAFYRNIVGLSVLSTSASETSLGSGNVPLLYLIKDTTSAPRPVGMPGLFHIAFLLPNRRDLGAWLHHAQRQQVALEGLSDHLVSEAAYLSDPEGNGIEIYVDRPSRDWTRSNGTITMGTSRMDVASVMAEAGSLAVPDRYQMPEATRIGHVHLAVAKLEDAAQSIGNVLGMTRMCSYPQADFYATGGYHHHIAANTWQTSPEMHYAEGYTGLKLVTLHAPEVEFRQALALRIIEAGGAQNDKFLLIGGPSGIPFALKLAPT
jgi:catechol 2,3-dioxygenase